MKQKEFFSGSVILLLIMMVLAAGMLSGCGKGESDDDLGPQAGPQAGPPESASNNENTNVTLRFNATTGELIIENAHPASAAEFRQYAVGYGWDEAETYEIFEDGSISVDDYWKNMLDGGPTRYEIGDGILTSYFHIDSPPVNVYHNNVVYYDEATGRLYNEFLSEWFFTVLSISGQEMRVIKPGGFHSNGKAFYFYVVLRRMTAEQLQSVKETYTIDWNDVMAVIDHGYEIPESSMTASFSGIYEGEWSLYGNPIETGTLKVADTMMGFVLPEESLLFKLRWEIQGVEEAYLTLFPDEPFYKTNEYQSDKSEQSVLFHLLGASEGNLYWHITNLSGSYEVFSFDFKAGGTPYRFNLSGEDWATAMYNQSTGQWTLMLPSADREIINLDTNKPIYQMHVQAGAGSEVNGLVFRSKRKVQ